jgi:hypothetical protein
MLEKLESCPECNSKMIHGWIGEKGSFHWYDNPKPIRTIFGVGKPIFDINHWRPRAAWGKQEARKCNNCGLIAFKADLVVNQSFLRKPYAPILLIFSVMILGLVIVSMITMNFALKLGRPTPLPDAVKLMSNVSPITGFRYFSGYYHAGGNHPAMYAYGSNDGEKIKIVGPGMDQEISMQQSAQAFQLYKDLLIQRGYKPE